MQQMEYFPQRLFVSDDYAVVLLNTNILLDNAFFLKIWNNAAIRHAIDGGSNQFFQLLDKLPEDVQQTVKYPELASGDFDSITDESMSRLKNDKRSQCKIIPTEDQDETDFTKGLRVLQDELKCSLSAKKVVKRIIVICEFSGRMDQVLANMNTLHKNVFIQDFVQEKPSATVYLLSCDTLSWLLPANINSIITFEKEVPNHVCGVVPFQGPTKYTSTGLQWDLSLDMVCQFGGLVSTSNRVAQKILHITPMCNHSVFTLELKATDYV